MALVNPNIALSFKPVEIPQQTNALAQTAQALQIQQAQMQMDKLRKTDEALERIRQAAMQHGGPDNLADIAKAYMQSPDAGHQELGLKILQQERDKQAFNTMFGADFGAAAPGAAAPAPANALVAPGAAPATAAAPANAMVAPSAAPAAAPVNAMAIQSPEQTIRRQIMQYSQLADPRAKVIVKQLEDQLKLYEPTELQRNYRAAKAEGYRGSLADFKVLSAPKTTVTLPGQKFESSYETTGGKTTFEKDDALVSTMEQAPQLVTKMDETLNILRNQDINTGLGAEVFNVLDKAKAQFAADKSAGKRVTSTEYLDALLGSDVFPQIQALGIGARGMDTPAEREFLRKVMTGSISLNKDTLIKMTELRRNALENATKQYNKRVDAGELDRYFRTTGRSKFRAELPAAPTGPVSATPAPAGVDQGLWNVMTTQERALWRK